MSASVDPLQAERGRLFALAYRMLGSAGEAEDAVQETYLRWYAQPRPEVENPPAFLTTVLTHWCLDQLKSARRRREQYPGVWLPEPVADSEVLAPEEDAGGDPQEQLQRLESVSLAFLSLLETLSPLERAVYLLAEVFDYPHAEVAAILGRSEEACRQVLRRARQSIEAGRRRASASAERHRHLLVSFLAACRGGEVDALASLLADDVVARADGGGQATSANRPVVGVRAVSRLYAALGRRAGPDVHIRIEPVNGWPAALLVSGGVLFSVLQVRTSGERIERIDNVLNPDKLARVAAAFGLRVAGRPDAAAHGRV